MRSRPSKLVTTIAELKGYDRRYVWLRIQVGPAKHLILTLPRKKLKRGFARAKTVKIEYAEDTLSFDGTHFVADVEMLSVEEYKNQF